MPLVQRETLRNYMESFLLEGNTTAGWSVLLMPHEHRHHRSIPNDIFWDFNIIFRTFVSEDLIKGLAEEIISGVDSVMGVPVSFGRGTSIIPTPAVSFF